MFVKHSEDGSPSSYRGNGVSTEPGDVVDVDEDAGEALLERIGFEKVGEDEYAEANDDADDADDADEDVEREDVDEWHDFDTESWLEPDYTAREEDVREGRVDAHLDTIEEVETSDTVLEAIEERRDQLAENAEVTDLDDVDVEEV